MRKKPVRRYLPVYRSTSPVGWQALLLSPMRAGGGGLRLLDLGRAALARDSLALLREHVDVLRCGGVSGTEQNEEDLRALDKAEQASGGGYAREGLDDAAATGDAESDADV